jgi:hypothetical protein
MSIDARIVAFIVGSAVTVGAWLLYKIWRRL